MKKNVFKPFIELEKETRTFDVNVLSEILLEEINKKEDKKYFLSGIDLWLKEENKYCFKQFLINFDDYAQIPNLYSFNSIEEFVKKENVILLNEFDFSTDNLKTSEEVSEVWNSEYEKHKNIKVNLNTINLKNFKYLFPTLINFIFERRELLSDNSYYTIIDESEFNNVDYVYVSNQGNNKILVIDLELYDNLLLKIHNSQYKKNAQILTLKK